VLVVIFTDGKFIVNDPLDIGFTVLHCIRILYVPFGVVDQVSDKKSLSGQIIDNCKSFEPICLLNGSVEII
jgi:hypothetical protein